MTKFAFGIHNHQPVGNIDGVNEHIYRQAYAPFLDVAVRFPSLRFNIHLSGPLLEWLGSRHPEYLEKVADLVGSGRVEVLGAGFGEPVLAIVPARDRAGQLLRYADLAEELFGQRPVGAWLTERVWEQHLVTDLVEAGYGYVMLDEHHFLRSGLRDLAGHYVTEDNGAALKLVPASRRLRYTVPFRPVDDAVSEVRRAEANGGFVCLFDDGEKFGAWPDTHKAVYMAGWLERFFGELESQGVETVRLSDYLASSAPLGRVYVDNASYPEMGEWVFDPESRRRYEDAARKLGADSDERNFLAGGFFRNFLVKYPEANRLHKRMCRVSEKVAAMDRAGAEYAAARDDLYRGQCNDVYWHGVFGGLYLPHLRAGSYRCLAKADRRAAGDAGPAERDFSVDGRTDFVVEKDGLFLVVLPSQGGAIWIWEPPGSERNVFDIVTCREESYHFRHAPTASGQKLRADGLPGGVALETRPRLSGTDRLLPSDATVDAFRSGRVEELVDMSRIPRTREAGDHRLKLECGGAGIVRRHSKTVEWDRGRLRLLVDADIDAANGYRLGVEFGVAASLIPEPTAGSVQGEPFRFVDREGDGKLEVRSTGRPVEFWSFPYYTYGTSMEGIERLRQGTILVAARLEMNRAANLCLELEWFNRD